ncbi:hypothetical protein Aple_097140 [Acrocarpospora pleiomorpha]|uniref:Uncharacterized protein n=1 Tax=Acrocarpospora pleiomorpha TaxID=90975 RepID=A0A5M3Y0F3_9ACTN|nr:hypothetical protein Aple_097140 [Acrocarpospora pleiomorpha]
MQVIGASDLPVFDAAGVVLIEQLAKVFGTAGQSQGEIGGGELQYTAAFRGVLLGGCCLGFQGTQTVEIGDYTVKCHKVAFGVQRRIQTFHNAGMWVHQPSLPFGKISVVAIGLLSDFLQGDAPNILTPMPNGRA